MVEPFKLAKFLDKLEITIEEYWLCYRILVLKNSYNNVRLEVPDNDLLDFGKLSQEYQERFKEVIDWKQLAKNLEEKGFICIWSHDLNNFDIANITIEEEFLQYFYIDDLRAAFAEFIHLYPRQIEVNIKGKRTVYSSYGKKSEDELITLMQKYILKGNSNILFARFMEITRMYLNEQSSKYAPYNIEGYFMAFEGIAKGYEEDSKIGQLFEDNI